MLKFGIKRQRTLILKYVICALFWAAINCGCPEKALAETPESASLSEVIFFGIRPVSDLNPAGYPAAGRQCVLFYLKAVPLKSPLRQWAASENPEKSLEMRRQNLEEQINVITGEKACMEAKTFADEVPLTIEWEGGREGPVLEAQFARQWLDRHPTTQLRPFFHLFMAHRLRAAFEAARREKAIKQSEELAKLYKEQLSAAHQSSNRLIRCIADDLEAQPYVYLSDFGRP